MQETRTVFPKFMENGTSLKIIAKDRLFFLISSMVLMSKSTTKDFCRIKMPNRRTTE